MRTANPFADSAPRFKPAWLGPMARRPALCAFLLCLVGALLVVWRSEAQATAARAHARTAALARSAGMELQFGELFAAVEQLGALATQNSGVFSNFQILAADLLAARPALTSLELEPGGVLTDIVPRADHERALGFNVLKNPTQCAGAYEALRSRSLTVAGPLTFDRGELVIVARTPVFQRTREGRDWFWGFVSGSLRLRDAMKQAGLADLSRTGYDYVLFAPAVAGRKAVTLASSGAGSFRDAEQAPVWARKLKLVLAVRPHTGWLNPTLVVFECVVVLGFGALFYAVIILLRGRQLGLERQTVLAQTDKHLAESQARLAEVQRKVQELQGVEEVSRANLSKWKEAETRANALQRELDSAHQTAAAAEQARQSELEQARQVIGEFESRLKAITSTEKQDATLAEARHQQDRSAIAELQKRLETAGRTAREAAEVSSTTIKRLEGVHEELKRKLQATEPLGARVIELTQLLEQTRAELHQLQAESARRGTEQPTDKPAPIQPEPGRRADREATKRLKVRRDGQIDLFERQPQDAAASPVTAIEAGTEAKRPSEASRNDAVVSAPAVSQMPAGMNTPEVEPGFTTPKETKPAPMPRLAAAPPVNPTQLRKAVNEILPLLLEQDPGAKDCLKANRLTFRSAFTPELFVEFEEGIKAGGFAAALEQLKKAAKKHGISV